MYCRYLVLAMSSQAPSSFLLDAFNKVMFCIKSRNIRAEVNQSQATLFPPLSFGTLSIIAKKPLNVIYWKFGAQ